MPITGTALPWRPVTLLSSLALLAGLGVISGGSAAAQTGLTVSNLVITNASGQPQMNFGAGKKLYFHYTLDNSTSQTITAEFQYYAYWGTVDEHPNEIIHHIITTGSVSVPPGTHTEKPPGGYYVLPSDSLPGFYSLQVTVDDQHSTSDASSEWQWFNVTSGLKPINVPSYTQFQSGNPESEAEDCGPTSVAMALAHYNLGPSGTAQQKIAAVRAYIASITTPPDTGGPTTGPELVSALNHYKANDNLIYENAAPQNTSVPAQLSEIAAAVKQGQPVIVFIDAQHLGSKGRDYTGHFLVIVGFGYNATQGVTVLVNDPDWDFLKGQAQPIPLGAFTNPAAGTFGQALTDATLPSVGGDPQNIAGIAVTR